MKFIKYMQCKQDHNFAGKIKEIWYIHIKKYTCQKNCNVTQSCLYAIFLESCRKQCYLYDTVLKISFLLEFSLKCSDAETE